MFLIFASFALEGFLILQGAITLLMCLLPQAITQIIIHLYQLLNEFTSYTKILIVK